MSNFDNMDSYSLAVVDRFVADHKPIISVLIIESLKGGASTQLNISRVAQSVQHTLLRRGYDSLADIELATFEQSILRMYGIDNSLSTEEVLNKVIYIPGETEQFTPIDDDELEG